MLRLTLDIYVIHIIIFGISPNKLKFISHIVDIYNIHIYSQSNIQQYVHKYKKIYKAIVLAIIKNKKTIYYTLHIQIAQK